MRRLARFLLNNNNGNNGFTPSSTTVIFRDGSITSASANGLTIPFGGTSDGITYQGADGTLFDLGYLESTNGTAVIVSGVSVLGTKIVGEKGAIIDLSGGGNLTGAGFVSGRGGSVDVLKTPLVNANPAYTYSSAGNKVYAILPGYASNYAPVIATNGAGNPIIGQQITIPAGVSGLPAGTYTLLPSSYALLPGAYRVEIGKAGTFATPPVGLPNGSVVTSGYLGIANTGVQDPLPTQLILTSGKAVRSYSQYNEMSYADFALSQAATFGAVRPRLPEDGKVLELLLGTSSGSGKLLTFEGTASFAGAGEGVAGSMFISTASTVGAIDITAPGAAPVAGHTSISSDDLNAFNAATLVIGGYSTYGNDTSRGTGARIYFSGSSTVNVLDGADVRAGQVFLVGKAINVAGGLRSIPATSAPPAWIRASAICSATQCRKLTILAPNLRRRFWQLQTAHSTSCRPSAQARSTSPAAPPAHRWQHRARRPRFAYHGRCQFWRTLSDRDTGCDQCRNE